MTEASHTFFFRRPSIIIRSVAGCPRRRGSGILALDPIASLQGDKRARLQRPLDTWPLGLSVHGHL